MATYEIEDFTEYNRLGGFSTAAPGLRMGRYTDYGGMYFGFKLCEVNDFLSSGTSGTSGGGGSYTWIG